MGYYGFKTSVHVDELERFMRAVRHIEKHGREASADYIEDLLQVAPYIAFCIEKGIPPEARDWDLPEA